MKNVYSVDAKWYSGHNIHEVDGDMNKQNNHGFVKLLFECEPTIGEIAQHIRIPKLLNDKQDGLISEIMGITEPDEDDPYRSEEFRIEDGEMHFSLSVKMAKMIENNMVSEMN